MLQLKAIYPQMILVRFFYVVTNWVTTSLEENVSKNETLICDMPYLKPKESDQTWWLKTPL